LKSSEERVALENALQHRQSTVEEIPIVIDGKEYWTDVHFHFMWLIKYDLFSDMTIPRNGQNCCLPSCIL
jgi:hypothetical protein